MTIPTAVLDGFDAERRLGELGVQESELRDALLYGYGYAASCTSHNPRTLPGTMAWGFTIGALRDMLVDRDWGIGRFNNFETVIHPSRSHAVAVTSGNAHAGDRTATPRTRYRKGETMALAVTGNTQMSFAALSDDDAFAPDESDPRTMHTWLLLHYHDRGMERIRAELSLPNHMENGWITGWAERIILGPMDFSTSITIIPGDDGDAGGDEIEIDVTRRVS
jgi:hypothetical protein